MRRQQTGGWGGYSVRQRAVNNEPPPPSLSFHIQPPAPANHRHRRLDTAEAAPVGGAGGRGEEAMRRGRGGRGLCCHSRGRRLREGGRRAQCRDSCARARGPPTVRLAHSPVTSLPAAATAVTAVWPPAVGWGEQRVGRKSKLRANAKTQKRVQNERPKGKGQGAESRGSGHRGLSALAAARQGVVWGEGGQANGEPCARPSFIVMKKRACIFT